MSQSATSAKNANDALTYKEWASDVNRILIDTKLLVESGDGTLFPVHNEPNMIHVIGFPNVIHDLQISIKDLEYSMSKRLFIGLQRYVPHIIIILVLIILGLTHTLIG